MFKLIFGQNCKTCRLYYCTSSGNTKKLYNKTVALPKTKFPLRLDNKKLLERDENIISVAEFNHLYNWQRSYLSEPEFVLHDGPPYANGNLHMGHALNKILKDTILRYEILKGHKVHFVPGWDCHGLPIELKALSDLNATPLEIRAKARDFVKSTINEQKEIFKSWGILGDWDHHYATYNPDYVKLQLKLFHKLYKKNLIYRDIKPIYWSPSSRTALAEAELEYNEQHKSCSIYTRFKLKHIPGRSSERIYALIWTTTPWTLPSNQAVCYNPSLSYILVENPNDNSIYIIASDLYQHICQALNCNLKKIDNIHTEILSQCTYIQPIYKNKELYFIPANHVTVTKGTGLVHSAPAHGPEDFLVALDKKMVIENLVDDLGCYNSEAGKDLEGKFVLEEGQQEVLHSIKNDIVYQHDYIHSYPYDWRTKEPVIIKASQQWFLDTDSIKNRAIDLLENVQIIPNAKSGIYKRNFINQIQKRPYWCISRQRKWGVPIPVFFNRSEEIILLNEDLIRNLCHLIDKHGVDCWWELSVDELIPEEHRSGLKSEEIHKSQDILDIWFDSGISWANALEGDKVADLYLEGVDQFTGWFQSSLITSIALRDKAPYKSIYVHGFVVDEQGMKMSKSLGNIVDPSDIVKGSKNQKAYGIDTLRWWVACHANQDSLAHISKNVLQACADEVQKIRSVLRFVLGSLYDYQHSPLDYKTFSLLDKYMLHLLYGFNEEIQEAMSSYQFQRICVLVINLLTNPVSALYYMGIKDRLYCDSADDISRRASQYVLLQIFETVTQAVAPIIPHLVEEMFIYLPEKNGKTYFTSTHTTPVSQWNNRSVDNVMNVILNMKKDINKEVGVNTLDTVVKATFSSKLYKLIEETSKSLDDFQAELGDIFQVAEVVVDTSDITNEYLIDISKSSQFTCARCRRVKSKCENELCARCSEVMKILDAKGDFAVTN